ncbi:hypothetical protein ACTOB_007669 [Actinoplanes oblitus]|uniref:Guanylate cyclase domain-containing protein n=1 Tax=Actinoplanes oblitus TaxID=3040509 RepID=A0ABY8WDU8_9ACTN|nr:hypothetical protein [Actinoplanes oblitus]WIM95552.1 hypothetical protein ACTOB_007669 [Actinoplanes oblitus]
MLEQEHAEAGGLPDLTAIMVVDTVKFSRHNDPQQDELAVLIPEVLEEACDRAGLEDLWAARQFPDSTGDGYLIGFAPGFLIRVVDRYFDALQEALRARVPRLRARNMRLRLRLSLDVGPARRLGDPRVGSPVGAAMIGTHRLVDARPLRALLEHSDPDVTLLAVALSDRVMTDVVAAGHTRRHVASEFAPCRLDIAEKDFSATAHLYVPALSGDILRHGLLGVLDRPTTDPEPAPAPRPPRQPRARGGVGQVAGRGNVVAGRDVDNVVAGRDVDRSRHDTTVHGDQYTAHRDMSIRRDAR